jgi:D-threonate/D-erythronate kinase
MRTNKQYTIGILADDLTSAADGAGPFVDRGLRAVIGRGCLPKEGATIVAVDSGSRSVAATQAAERAAELAAQLASRDVLYKTVDSTLRGHVTAELEAAFKASGRKMLVFAPAFPAAGR